MNLNPFKKRPPVKIQVIQRDPCRLSLSEWCSQPDLVRIASRMLSTVDFRTMLDVVEFEHPAGIVLDDRVSLEARAVWQARCEGYTMAISNLLSMDKLRKPQEPLEATFEAPEPEENDQL